MFVTQDFCVTPSVQAQEREIQEKKSRVVFRFTIKREIYERNAPKGVLLERFHLSGQQPCKFIQTPTWPPFCCIGTPKWRT